MPVSTKLDLPRKGFHPLARQSFWNLIKNFFAENTDFFPKRLNRGAVLPSLQSIFDKSVFTYVLTQLSYAFRCLATR